MISVTREQLLDLLSQWGLGKVDEREVHEQAEAIVEAMDDSTNYPESNPHSITLEVLVHLDALNHQLITAEDIPAMCEFLETPEGDETGAWVAWREYWAGIDMTERRRMLTGNCFYST